MGGVRERNGFTNLAMLNKKIITKIMKHILMVVALLVATVASGQTRYGTAVKACVTDGRVMLRWAPKDVRRWQAGSKEGYIVERYTIVKSGEVLSTTKIASRKVRSKAIKAQPLEAWETYAGKKLNFEVIDEVGDKIRRVDLKVYDENLERNIFYEFKSVQGVPPDDFFDQFGKDLANSEVDDLSQIKWIFDGKKVTQEQLTNAVKKAIEEWNVPEKVLENWNFGLSEGVKFKNEKILPFINSIFKAE